MPYMMPPKYKTTLQTGQTPVGQTSGLASSSSALMQNGGVGTSKAGDAQALNRDPNSDMLRRIASQQSGTRTVAPTQSDLHGSGGAAPAGTDTQGGTNANSLTLTGVGHTTPPTSTNPNDYNFTPTDNGLGGYYTPKAPPPGANVGGQIGVVNTSGSSAPSGTAQRDPHGVENGADRTDPSLQIDPDAKANLAAENQWKDVMKQYDDSYKNIEPMSRDFESRANRRSMEMNARLGAGAGGGAFASGLGQAEKDSEGNRLKLEHDYQNQGMELKMTHLQHLLQQAKDKGDKAQQKDIQNMIDETMYNMALVQQGPSPK